MDSFSICIVSCFKTSLFSILNYSSSSPLRFLKSTDATTGAPTKAVTEFTGKAPSNPGIRAMRLHTNANEAPTSNVAGISIRWSDVWNIARQRWGTARPINIIGPQYAVTIATNTPEQEITNRRALLMFSPRFRAYPSPRDRKSTRLNSSHAT